jgi:hypothetical protein
MPDMMMFDSPGTGDPERNGDVRFTNPNYYEGREWQVNCQRVTVAYELRRRGYLVEAEPNHKGRSKSYPWESLSALWHRPDVWKTYDADTGKFSDVPEGTPNSQLIPGGPAIWDRPRTKAALLAEIDRWPSPSRGWLGGAWKGENAAHIWNVEKLADGTVLFIDAQPRIAGQKVANYLDDIKEGTFHLMRVDHLEPEDDEMTKMVRPVQPDEEQL